MKYFESPYKRKRKKSLPAKFHIGDVDKPYEGLETTYSTEEKPKFRLWPLGGNRAKTW